MRTELEIEKEIKEFEDKISELRSELYKVKNKENNDKERIDNMFKEMNKKEKMECIISICKELEQEGFYPLRYCIGLGECILRNKISHCGTSIKKYMEIALDNLIDNGLPLDKYNLYLDKLK